MPYSGSYYNKGAKANLPIGLYAFVFVASYPASYTTGTGSFPGVKRPGRGVDHPPHLAPRLEKEFDVQVTVHRDKHVEFYYKNKIEKLVYLLGFKKLEKE